MNHYRYFFVWKSYKLLLFRRKKLKILTLFYKKDVTQYKPIVVPAKKYQIVIIMFLNKKLQIITFSSEKIRIHKNHNIAIQFRLLKLSSLPLFLSVWLLSRGNNYCSSKDHVLCRLTGHVMSQSAESCSIGSPVLCR